MSKAPVVEPEVNPTEPQCVRSFAEMPLRSELQLALKDLGFITPTPVQAALIPQLLEKRKDCLALAATGTGKTAAFGLPLLNAVSAGKVKHPEALVVCPTRELCNQIAVDLRAYAKRIKDVRILAVYGGADIHFQTLELYRGVSILVATPGRLVDLMDRGAAKLDAVRCLVLDEADEMLQMGFQDDLNTITAAVPEKARTWMFSATMDKQTKLVADKLLTNPILVNTIKKTDAPQIFHQCYVFKKHADRAKCLDKLLKKQDFFGLVFLRTRDGVRNLSQRYKAGDVASLRGDMPQKERDKVMRAFRRHEFKALLATDIAARGIDVDDISHVIHYDIPDDAEAYTHRSGRTARAGKTGTSILFALEEELSRVYKLAKQLKVFIKITKQFTD